MSHSCSSTILSLPPVVVAHCLCRHLRMKDIGSVGATCRALRKVIWSCFRRYTAVMRQQGTRYLVAGAPLVPPLSGLDKPWNPVLYHRFVSAAQPGQEVWATHIKVQLLSLEDSHLPFFAREKILEREKKGTFVTRADAVAWLVKQYERLVVLNMRKHQIEAGYE
jgi:hypothetical protein